MFTSAFKKLEHTPNLSFDGHGLNDVAREYSPRIAMFPKDMPHDEREAYAAHITKAVNLYPDLVQILERALAIRNPNVKWTKAEKEREWPIWENQVSTLLAKAKEQ